MARPSSISEYKRLGVRCHVRMFVPSSRIQSIAAERTDGMVDYFLLCPRSGRHQYDDHLRRLVRSAYMQGLEDLLEIIRTGKVNEFANGENTTP